MIGLGMGGVWGLSDGIRSREMMGTSTRLRATAILNGLTRRGPFLANTSAVIGGLIRISYWYKIYIHVKYMYSM